ncbi:MAG: type I restriction endonuclease subunit R [Leptospiraceae bacterium]|nr:type I restriction endonuclease subunit R [Leptospiraceae bacterium]
MSKEKIFENHIAGYLKNNHSYRELKSSDITDKDYHFIDSQIMEFLESTQPDVLEELTEIYGSGVQLEIFRSLKNETEKKALWDILRHGIFVTGQKLHLLFPKPRAFGKNLDNSLFSKNIFSYKTQYHFSKSSDHSIDIVLFLNGFPIITIELKHIDENQNYENAIEQYDLRDHKNSIFQLPFLHIAMDTEKVQVSTSPPEKKNFRWFNQGLINEPRNKGEYSVEYMYADVLYPDWISEYIETYLVFVNAKEVITDKGIIVKENSFSIFPRFHQIRCTKKVSLDIQSFYEEKKNLGKKYLIQHSAGSGKTLTISWMADRLNSLHDSRDQKIFEMIFILTDRKSLNKNIKDELKKFSHLENSILFCNKSKDLAEAIQKRKNIVVTTIQKFGYIQDKLKDESRDFRIAILIDEAHRSQEGKSEYNMRAVFKKHSEEDSDVEEETFEDEIVKKLKELEIDSQVFIAFTATPTQKTITAFQSPFDVYTEQEAIEENYIIDVADKIISYSTLYNFKAKNNFKLPEDKEFPKVTLANALRNLAFRDESLILYKSTIIINHFLENVIDDLGGKAKAMVVSSSRPSGYIYYKTLKSIIEEKNLGIKILYAFSDYIDDETKEEVSEVKVNQLDILHGGKSIEEVFENDEYRIMIVANKFQTGFDEPKLTAMYLDKVIKDLTAVQTISRLNRMYPGKNSVSTIDFTNNSEAIFKAFAKYRGKTLFKYSPPDTNDLKELVQEALSYGILIKDDVEKYNQFNPQTQDPELSEFTKSLRNKLKSMIPLLEERKRYINLLNRLVSTFFFTSKFFELEKEVIQFCMFVDAVKDILLNESSSSMKDLLKNIYIQKGAVRFNKVELNPKKKFKKKSGSDKRGGGPSEILKITLPNMLEEIKERFQISPEEEIAINDIAIDIQSDESIVEVVKANKDNELFLLNSFLKDLVIKIKEKFYDKDMSDKLDLDTYSGEGGIIQLMARSIIGKLQYG